MKRLLVIPLIALAVSCSRGGDATTQVPADTASKLLIDRNWIDVWPESKDEPLHVYRFVPSMGGGVYQDRTLYAGTFELFLFKVHGNEIAFDMPHRGDDMRTRFRIDRVDSPKPFDLKLTLTNSPRGPAVYYSIEAGLGHVDALLANRGASTR